MLSNDPHPNKKKQSKRQLLQRLKANIPKTPSCLNAVWSSHLNRIVDEPAEVAVTINNHWQQIFNATEIDKPLMDEWINSIEHKLDLTQVNLQPTVQQVRETILSSGPSSPGPDGIPFEAYKAVVDVAAIILQRVASNLINAEEAKLPRHFNAAVLVLLPKKPSFVDAVRGP